MHLKMGAPSYSNPRDGHIHKHRRSIRKGMSVQASYRILQKYVTILAPM